MNATAHTACVIDRQRSAQLDGENELIRSQRERSTIQTAHAPSSISSAASAH